MHSAHGACADIGAAHSTAVQIPQSRSTSAIAFASCRHLRPVACLSSPSFPCPRLLPFKPTRRRRSSSRLFLSVLLSLFRLALSSVSLSLLSHSLSSVPLFLFGFSPVAPSFPSHCLLIQSFLPSSTVSAPQLRAWTTLNDALSVTTLISQSLASVSISPPGPSFPCPHYWPFNPMHDGA